MSEPVDLKKNDSLEKASEVVVPVVVEATVVAVKSCRPWFFYPRVASPVVVASPDMASPVMASPVMASPEPDAVVTAVVTEVVEAAVEILVHKKPWYYRCIPMTPKKSEQPTSEPSKIDLSVREPVNVPGEVPVQESSKAVVPA